MHARELFSKDERWQEMKTKQKKKKEKLIGNFFGKKKYYKMIQKCFHQFVRVAYRLYKRFVVISH